MSDFKMCCPKCGARNVDVYLDKSSRWASYAPKGELTLHCPTCGKLMYGKAVEQEIAQQREAWENASPERMEQRRRQEEEAARQQALRRALVESREMARREMQDVLAQATALADKVEHCRQRLEALRQPHGSAPSEATILVMNRIRVDLNRILHLSGQVAGPGQTLAQVKENVREMEKLLAMSESGVEDMARALKTKAEDKAASVPSNPFYAERGDTCAWKDCDKPPRAISAYCSLDCRNKNARWRYRVRKGLEAADPETVRAVQLPSP